MFYNSSLYFVLINHFKETRQTENKTSYNPEKLEVIELLDKGSSEVLNIGDDEV